MPYSDYVKRRALHFHECGLRPPAIVKALAAEGETATRQGVAKMLRRVESTGSLRRSPGSGRLPKVTPAVKAAVDAQMRADDETTATQLEVILRHQGIYLSKSTILRSRSLLGWTFRGSAYCQMIRRENKMKRLDWARQYVDEAANGFLDVIYSDETSIQLEAHRRFSFRKVGEPPRPKPK